MKTIAIPVVATFAAICLILVAVVGYTEIQDPPSDTFKSAYDHGYQYDFSDEAHLSYAELIDAGFTHSSANTRANRLDRASRLSTAIYASESGESHARPVPIIVEFAESSMYAAAYSKLTESGKSPDYAQAYADARFLYFLTEDRAHEVAEDIDTMVPVARLASLDVAVVLAMYSTTDDSEADKRAASVREMTDYLERGDMDNDTALDLLNDIAPEVSISERVEAASRLSNILDDGDDGLTEEQGLQVANELTRLITGHGIDAEQRTEAARKMVRLSQSGELNAENSTELMAAIAPEWSVEERKEALGYLAWQFSDGGEWDADSTKRTAEEGYTLITGGEIQLEMRMESSVKLAGEGLKRYGGDSYDAESVDQAVTLTQGAIRGDLTLDSVSDILGISLGDRNASVDAEPTKYSRLYAEQIDRGKSSKYARAYAETRVAGASAQYSHAYAESIDADKSESYSDSYAVAYVRHINSGRTEDFASAYAWRYMRQMSFGRSPRYAHAYAGYFEAHLGYVAAQHVYRSFIKGHTYAKQIDDGKPESYAYIAASAVNHYENYVNYRADLSNTRLTIVEKESGILSTTDKSIPNMITYIDIYMEQVEAGESALYVSNYTRLICDGKSESYAHNYTEQVVDNRVDRYAHGYAYAREYHSQRDVSYAHIYAHAYAQTTSNPEDEGDDFRYNTIYVDNPDRFATTYAEQIIAGRSDGYARYYAKQIIAGKTSTYAHAYAEKIVAGKSMEYANLYAWLIYFISGRW